MQPTLPQDIALALPVVAAAFVHYLMADRLEPWKNALIAGGFVLATALLCVWLSGSFIPGNAQASVMVVLAYVAFLMRGPLSAIMIAFADMPSPFDAKPSPWVQPLRTSPVTRAYTPSPTPIVLPAGSSPVPPRASAPPAEPPSAG